MQIENDILRSLSSKQAQLLLGLLEAGATDVNRDAVIERMRVSPGYANKLLHELTAKGWLYRLAHGRYRVVPPEWGPTAIPNSQVYAQALARAPDGYLGLATAAAIQGLTTQHRNTVWVMSAHFRRSTAINETTVQFVHIKPADRFGVEEKVILGESSSVSDVEKTALDCLAYGLGRFDFAELTAIVLKAVRKGRWETFARYLEQMNNGPVVRRLGFLLDTANVSVPNSFKRQLRRYKASNNLLNLVPTQADSPSFGVNHDWRIRINTPIEDLFRV
jgi:predicted transcriptional regulator of viral defense system